MIHGFLTIDAQVRRSCPLACGGVMQAWLDVVTSMEAGDGEFRECVVTSASSLIEKLE